MCDMVRAGRSQRGLTLSGPCRPFRFASSDDRHLVGAGVYWVWGVAWGAMTFLHSAPFRTQALPLSPVRLQELQGKFRPVEQEPLTGRRYQSGGLPPTALYDVERAIALKAQEYLETDSQRRLRYAQWLALILSLTFIGSIVVLLAMLCVKVNDVFDAVDGSDTSAKVTTLMDMAVEGANNARLATQNVLDVTAFARQTASVAGPKLEHVANTTKDLVTDLRSFSFHPSLQIAPGG